MNRSSKDAPGLGRTLTALCTVLAMSGPPLVAALTPSVARAQEVKKVTVASITARRDRLLKARDALLALAAQPAPKELTAEQAKHHAALVAGLKEVAGGCDATATKITRGLAASKPDLDALSEMSEQDSMRLQMAMDRQTKEMQTISNVLKKISDTANGIVSNMK